MNKKHRKTIDALFAESTNVTIEWARIEAALVALGCRVIEGPGTAVTFEHSGYTARMDFDAEDKIIVGRVVDIDVIITFHGP
jgi:hypothetical protein